MGRRTIQRNQHQASSYINLNEVRHTGRRVLEIDVAEAELSEGAEEDQDIKG